MKYAPASVNIARSQAVARIADRTSSQHFWGSSDVISHVTIWYPYVASYWWSFGLTKTTEVTEIYNVEYNAMVDMTLIRPLNKGQGHSFWYQSDFSYMTSYRLSIVTFALGRTVYNHNTFRTDRWRQTDDRRTQHCSVSAKYGRPKNITAYVTQHNRS